MKNRWLFTLASSLAVGLTATPAIADISARYEFEHNEMSINMAMTIEIDSAGNERIQMANQAGYMLILNDVPYMIIRGPAGVYVMRMDDMVTVIGEAAKRNGLAKAFASIPPDTTEKPPTMASMGPKVVNGRTGTAYGISEKGARPVLAILVVSNDPKLAPLGAAFVKSFAQSSSLANKMIPGLGNMAEFFGPGGAILKTGTPLSILFMNLTDVSFTAIDKGRFALPSAPLSIEQIRQQYESFPEPPTLPAPAD